MRHLNSRRWVVFGLTTVLICGCACRGKCRVPGSVASRSGACCQQADCVSHLPAAANDHQGCQNSADCSCYACLEKSLPGTEQNAASTLLKVPENKSGRYDQQSANFEIDDAPAGVARLHDPNQPSRASSKQASLSSEHSSRAYYHGDVTDPDADLDATNSEISFNKIVVSEELYASSSIVPESKKQIVESQLPMPIDSVSLDSSLLSAPPQQTSLNPVTDSDSIVLPESRSCAELKNTDPSNGETKNSVVLHADPLAPRDFLDSVVQRRKQQQLSGSVNSATESSSPDWAAEPVQFRPLPDKNNQPADHDPAIDQTELKSKTAGMLDAPNPFRTASFRRFPTTNELTNRTDKPLVPIQQPSSNGTSVMRLPSSSSQPMMMQVTSSKRAWESAPKLDPVMRAKLNSQALQHPLPESDRNWNHKPTSQSPEKGTYSPRHQSYSDNLRLRATPQSSDTWLPPVVNIHANKSLIEDSNRRSLPADNDQRLEKLHRQLHEGVMPDYRYGPPMDIQIDEAIRHLTIRPNDTNDKTKTLER